MNIAKRITNFEGVFCSGFYIPDQRFVTALSLLFNKVHFLNQLEYVIEFSKRYRIVFENDDDLPEIKLDPKYLGDPDDPLEGLTNDQRKTVYNYLILSDQFFTENALLFPEVFNCSLLPNGEVFSAELVKKGKWGRLNTYNVTKNPLVVSMTTRNELSSLVNSGCVPVFLNNSRLPAEPHNEIVSAHQIAANIALNTVAMVLPATKAAKSSDILEAREKLSDHLPYFWSSMLKLSAEAASRIDKNANQQEVEYEIKNLISTTVQPALIDLVEKLKKERKTRFRKIITSAANGLKVFVGKPPTDLAGLVTGSLVAGSEVAMEFANHLRKVDSLKQESGMAYLLEIDKLFSDEHC